MTPNRHTGGAVLDAVRASVLAVGVRRTTLTDVARRADVSRMTLYRRYPDVDALVRELMTREFSRVLRDAQLAAAGSGRGAHARARLVAVTVAAAAGLRTNPVFCRVADVDPDLLLPYVTDRLGATQLTALEFLADGVAAGQRDGSVRDGDTRQFVHGALLVIQSFVLSARVVADVLDSAALDGELASVLDRYLAP
jgi:AcrR family transcriptional regulator